MTRRGSRGAVAIAIILSSLALAPVTVLATSGDLDLTFNGTGKVTTTMGQSDGDARGLALQENGKIVQAGVCRFAASGSDFCLARYYTDGTLDPSFGVGGMVSTSFSDFDPLTGFVSNDSASALIVQGDGKVVAAGTCSVDRFLFDPTTPGTSPGFCVSRYNPNGSLDTTFGDQGLALATFPSVATNPNWIYQSAEATGMALQSDGKIVVAGSCVNAQGWDFQVAQTNSPPVNSCLARFTASGSLDATFGLGGKVVTSLFPFPVVGTNADSNWVYAVALQSDGKIVTAGRCNFTGTGCLARYNSNGSLDSTFDGDGIIATTIGSGNGAASDVAIQGDGKLIEAGQCSVGFYAAFCLARHNIDGSLDASFDGDGLVTTIMGVANGGDNLTAIALQADGKILGAGSCLVGAQGNSFDFCLARYTSGGALDISFDGDGKTTTNIGNLDTASALAVQDDGKIVAGGTCFNVVQRYCLVRYQGDEPSITQIDLDWRIDERFVIGGAIVSQDLKVHLFCDPAPDASAGVTEYRWRIDRPGHATETFETDDCSKDLTKDVRTDEGVWTVTVEAFAGASLAATSRRAMVIQDFLIVSIGDSVGSGEGNPDVRCVGACGKVKKLPSGSAAAVWQEPGCHRSHFAGSALAPLAVEKADAHSSVTFLHLACSGASIAEGLLGAYTGIDGKRDYDPQLKDVLDLVPGREIDGLLISIGGNDIQFSDALVDCAYPKPAYCNSKWDPVIQSALTELRQSFAFVQSCVAGSPDECRAGLDSKQIKRWGPGGSLGMDAKRVYITTYYDPTTDESGDPCDQLDILNINSVERDWFSGTVIPDLNFAIAETAATYQWNLIGGAASAFKGHGYCASDSARWMRQVTESVLYQGDKYGTMHPNEQGHEWYAAQLLSSMNEDLFAADGLPREPQPPAAP